MDSRESQQKSCQNIFIFLHKRKVILITLVDSKIILLIFNDSFNKINTSEMFLIKNII